MRVEVGDKFEKYLAPCLLVLELIVNGHIRKRNTCSTFS
jgi:hypothetical protein